MNKSALIRSSLLSLVMVSTAIATYQLQPTNKLSEQSFAIDLNVMVPKTFSGWQLMAIPNTMIIDPQQAENLARIYTQTLSRTYVNREGYRVMLSIAYGDDQRDSMAMHYPEVCYPAQGFRLNSSEIDILDTRHGSIPIKRLETALGGRREPVTYWHTVGDRVVRKGVDKKLAEINYGIKGIIPDGLLFRVSSVDGDSSRAFSIQKDFILDILDSMDPSTRSRFAGLGSL